MNSKNLAIGGLAGALIVVLIAAGLTFVEVEGDITNESKAEMFNFMAENYVSVDDYENDLDDIVRAIAHPHMELNDLPAIQLAIQNIRNDIQTIEADIRDLERDDTPAPDIHDFNLESCEDFNCTDETSTFNAGDVVYVSGENPSNDRTLEYKLYDPDGIRIDSRNVSMQPNSPFIIAIQTDNDFEDGNYRVLVEIDRETDEINFRIN